MSKYVLVSCILLVGCSFQGTTLQQAELKDSKSSVLDPNFLVLQDGTDLSQVSVGGVKLTLTRGTGNAFTATEKAKFETLRDETQTAADHPVQWVLMNLDNHQVIDRSYNAERKIFGASTSKIFVSGALLNKQNGTFTNSQLQKLADMIVVSSNTAWTDLQQQIGDGNSDLGRERIHKFTQNLGYVNMRGYQGDWNGMHGNELTATELAEYLYDMYHGKFPGAEVTWKLMHTGRTGNVRAKKYLPNTIFVGGKTGTYDGPTTNPDTGSTTNPDGSAYTVKVRNHAIVFQVNGRQYGLAILANTGKEESAALLAGGLFNEL